MRFDDHGSFAAGDAIRVKVKARGSATGGGSRLAFVGAVSASEGVTIEPQTTTLCEGLHGLRISSGSFSRTISGLDATKNYLFSIWKNLGAGWVPETRRTLPATGGSLTITLSQAGLYDLAELMVDTGQALPESWIPENRLGRVDWFITDHLGSTKLLIDQNGQHRFTGDDDPFGINLRSFGDKDTRRFTGQILDEEQGVYYYGARYYLPEIGRFLSGDPKKQYPSLYIYCGNTPTSLVDPDGEADEGFGATFMGMIRFGFYNFGSNRTESGKKYEEFGKNNGINITVFFDGKPGDKTPTEVMEQISVLQDAHSAEGIKTNITIVPTPIGSQISSHSSLKDRNEAYISLSKSLVSRKQSSDANMVVLVLDNLQWEALTGSLNTNGFRDSFSPTTKSGLPFGGILVSGVSSPKRTLVHEFFHSLGYYTEGWHNGRFEGNKLKHIVGGSVHNDIFDKWIKQFPSKPNRTPDDLGY